MASVPDSAQLAPAADPALLQELAGLVVAELNLEVRPQDIAPDAPLYGEGLGLDSIDILELALVVSRRYGVRLRSDHEDNAVIFASLSNLARYIAQNRTKWSTLSGTTWMRPGSSSDTRRAKKSIR